jgi:hypothetical protein
MYYHIYRHINRTIREGNLNIDSHFLWKVKIEDAFSPPFPKLNAFLFSESESAYFTFTLPLFMYIHGCAPYELIILRFRGRGAKYGPCYEHSFFWVYVWERMNFPSLFIENGRYLPLPFWVPLTA